MEDELKSSNAATLRQSVLVLKTQKVKLESIISRQEEEKDAHQEILQQLKLAVEALQTEEQKHLDQIRTAKESKQVSEDELNRVLQVLLPELKCKLQSVKDENDSLTAQMSFLQLERGSKIVKMQKEHLIAIKKLRTEVAEKEARLMQHSQATKLLTEDRMNSLSNLQKKLEEENKEQSEQIE